MCMKQVYCDSLKIKRLFFSDTLECTYRTGEMVVKHSIGQPTPNNFLVKMDYWKQIFGNWFVHYMFCNTR
jgi:hypothetical protein